MAKLSKDDVLRMASQAGLDVDDARAETIASRLGAVIEEWDDPSPMWRVVNPELLTSIADLDGAASDEALLRVLVGGKRAVFWASDRF